MKNPIPLFLCLIILSLPIHSSLIDAIQPNWPFQIDYILLQKNYVYMDGGSNSASSDPGSRNVLFPKRLFAIPDSILLTICKYYVRQSRNYVGYSMSYSALTDTGFILHSSFPPIQYKDILISYMTVYNNYGVQVHNRGFSDFAYSLASSYHTYTTGVMPSSVSLNPVSSAEQFVAVYTTAASFTSFNEPDLYTTNYTVTSSNSISIRVYIPQSATVSQISLTILIMHYPTLHSAISTFEGYQFQGHININVVNDVRILQYSTNQSSTLYLVSSPTTGGLVRSYNYAFTFTGPPDPPVGGFTVDFMRGRDDNLNKIETKYFSSSTTVSDSVFAYIRLQRTKCTSITHPYLMRVKQQCHGTIPNNYYSNANKQLNLCSACTNIVGCLDCMDTMCTSAQYLNPSNFVCVACSTIDADCESCRNVSCTKCRVSSKKVVEGGGCVTCNSTDYFDTGTESCVGCTAITPNCGSCDGVSCLSCSSASMTVLVSGACEPCPPTQYYNTSLTQCSTCIDYDPNCELCDSTQCLSCSVLSQTVVSGGVCAPCPFGFHFAPLEAICKSCSLYNCLECSNPTHCSTCVSGEFELINGYCVLKVKIRFSFEAFSITHSQNTIQAYIYFNQNITIIESQYFIDFTLKESNDSSPDPNISGFTFLYLHHNNTLKAIINCTRSLNHPTLSIKFTSNLPYQSLLSTEDSTQLGDIFVINPYQKAIYEGLSQFTSAISENSGSILTTLSLTDASMLVINILWSAQMTSYYIFLPVSKPKNLVMFLNVSFALLDIDIMPFRLPNPMIDSVLDAKGDPIYEEYNVDIYFLRNSIESLMSMVLFGVFYFLLRCIFSQFKRTNWVIAFGQSQFVKKFCNNISTMVYSYLTVMTFSASVSLTVRTFHSPAVILNYLAGLFFMFLFLAIAVIHPIILFTNRKQAQASNPLLKTNDQEKYGELLLLLFILSQVLIPILIPLFHPLFTIFGAISLETINIYVSSHQEKLIDKHFRMMKSGCCIVFNVVMLGLFVLQKMFSTGMVEESLVLGYVGIIAVVFMFVIGVIELVVQLTQELYSYFRSKCQSKGRGKSRVRTANNMSVKNEQRQLNNSSQKQSLENTNLSQSQPLSTNPNYLSKPPSPDYQTNSQLAESDIKLMFSRLSPPLQNKSQSNQKSRIQSLMSMNNSGENPRESALKTTSSKGKAKPSKFSYLNSKLHCLNLQQQQFDGEQHI